MSNNLPLLQWSFLQYKKLNKSSSTPLQCFLQSCTQIGSKLLMYGGCNIYGEAVNQLFVYDTQTYEWSAPCDGSDYSENHPGSRYGHSATVIEMHPPRIMIYGGMISGGTFEFDSPDGMVDDSGSSARSFSQWRQNKKKGVQRKLVEETDECVYFLELKSENWVWSKPMVLGNRSTKPVARTEHSACKTGTNEVSIFGGWAEQPMNDLWVFDFVDMEWKESVTSGIFPKSRYRHSSEVIGRKLFILGGSDNNDDIAEGCKSLGIHQLDLETMQWSHPPISGTTPFPRSGHASCVVGAQTIAIFGGKLNNEVFFNDLFLIDTFNFTSTIVNAVEACLPTPVQNCSISAVGNRCFVFGGTDVKANCFNDIRSLDIGTYLDSNDITVGEGSSSDYSFKILIIGDSGVGKSALMTRFSDNVFVPTFTATIGIDFNSRMIRLDRAICKLEIWDTAGQERFSTITANYYRGAQGALLVFDIASRSSFEHVKAWYDRAKLLGGEEMETILVGNKSDLLEREVSVEEGEAAAKELDVVYVETSALRGDNVETAFVSMTACIKKSVDRRGLSGVKDSNLQSAGGVQIASGERKMSTRERCGC